MDGNYMDGFGNEDYFDPFDIDREEFNPSLCILRYTEECSLKNLIAREGHIVKDIRDLENDFQNMLYDNYRKVINAASFVSNMTKDFQKMESDIDLLHCSLKDIEVTSSIILRNLKPTEDKVSKLLNIQSVMKRLVSLTDLVSTIRRIIDSDGCVAAAKHYLKAKNLLEKYKTLTSISGIVEDCDALTERIKDGLKMKLDCEIYGKEEISETLNLILALGECPKSLFNHFMTICGKSRKSYLDAMDDHWKNMQEETVESDTLNRVIVCYFNSSSSYVEKVSKIVEVAKSSFLASSHMDMSVNTNLVEFVHSSTYLLSIKLRKHLRSKFGRIDDAVLSHVHDKFLRQCYNVGVISPRFNLYQKCMNIILKICTDRCDFHLQKVKDAFNVTLGNLVNNLKQIEKQLEIPDLVESTEHLLNQTLQSLVCYIRPEFICCRQITFRKIFCKVLVREGIFVEFFRYVLNHIRDEISSTDPKQSAVTPPNVVFAKYFLRFHQIIPKFMSKVDDSLCSLTDNLSLSSAVDISKEYKIEARAIIEAYVSVHLQNISQMARKSLESRNAMKASEPIRPGALVIVVFRDIQNIKIETEKVFGVCQTPFRGREYGLEIVLSCTVDGSHDGSSIEQQMMLNKLFLKDAKLLNKVDDLNSYSIISCLIRMILKSFLEYIRLHTFNHYSFQQIHIDMCYLKSRISQIFICTSDIYALFDDIMSSAYNRTYQPKVLSPHVVAAICNDTY